MLQAGKIRVKVGWSTARGAGTAHFDPGQRAGSCKSSSAGSCVHAQGSAALALQGSCEIWRSG
eukprot:1508974-Pyramimonas_sp.AAC.1